VITSPRPGIPDNLKTDHLSHPLTRAATGAPFQEFAVIHS
jgi:hypothetical protein